MSWREPHSRQCRRKCLWENLDYEGCEVRTWRWQGLWHLGEGTLGLEYVGPEDRSGLPHIPSPPPALPSQENFNENKPEAQAFGNVIFQKCQLSQWAHSFLSLLLWHFCPSVLEPCPKGACHGAGPLPLLWLLLFFLIFLLFSSQDLVFLSLLWSAWRRSLTWADPRHRGS